MERLVGVVRERLLAVVSGGDCLRFMGL
jgi:hypothetical protein